MGKKIQFIKKILKDNEELKKRLAYNEKLFNHIYVEQRRTDILEQQLKYAESTLTDVQADKFRLRERLELTIRALGFYADKNNYQGSPSLIDMQDNGEKAREVIKILGNDEGDK
jgi:hypothetical protein